LDYNSYLEQRKILENENANLVGNVINDSEKKVDSLLNNYKNAVYSENETDRLFKMNLLSNDKLWESDLYKLICEMPKGADLHVHATALVPAHKLIGFVKTHTELLVDINDGHIYHIDEETYNKEKCFTLSEILDKGMLSVADIEKKWSMLGRVHNQNVWEYFENLLCIFESIEYSYDTLFDYYVFAFKDYLSLGINHIEIHAVLSEDREKAFELTNVIKKAYFAVKKEHTELIVSIICAGLKYLGVEESVPKTYLENALWLKDKILDDFYPEEPHRFIIGFDLVNEEDKSVPLKDFAPLLLECREKYPDFNLYIHCGESLDAQSDNLIDAYLLDSKRVGHGMNLYRYPKLLQRYAEREICLECCVISNQTLKYTKDIRLHPGAEYLKRGVTIALCSDDPVCQEHEQLCDDFFASVICWNLNISDIKQLCINSILYSGVDSKQKSQMIGNFKKAWQEFIEKYSKM